MARVVMDIRMDGYEEEELTEEGVEEFIKENLDSAGVSVKVHIVNLEDYYE